MSRILRSQKTSAKDQEPKKKTTEQNDQVVKKRKASIEPLESKPIKSQKTEKTSTPVNTNDNKNDTENTQGYWLMKAEPSTRLVNGYDVKFSIDDLEELGESDWDGVRNHEAKNNMMAMKPDDLCFFYHSNAPKTRPDLGPGIVGIMRVVNKEPIVDYTAFDKTHPYYDAKSNSKEKPRWFMSRVKFERKLKRLIPLSEIKDLVSQRKVKELENFALVKRSRLSVVPVIKQEWDYILGLENEN